MFRSISFLCLLPMLSSALFGADLAKTPHWRHPVAMVTVGDQIYLANERSGTISVLDANTLAVNAEIPVGKKLSDLEKLGADLVAVDEESHQMILLKAEPKGISVVTRINVAKTPVEVCSDSQGGRCAVASLWSRRVSVFQREDNSLAEQFVIDLPFSPRKLLWLDDDRRLIAADAFGGRLAVIETETGRLFAVKKLAGHNIRGLAISGDGQDLLISQQVLNSESETTHTPVFWGDLMQNVLRSHAISQLLDESANGTNTGDLFRTEPLGHPSSATGDPHDVLVLPTGQTVVSLSGVGEIAIRQSDHKPFERFEAQSRSTALLAHPYGKRILVANTFADSLTVFDLETWRISEHVSLGPTPALTETERGERLFFDAKVSLDGWYSCHSCHTDGHTTGLRNDNLSDKDYGAPKRILPLGGVTETKPWAWNGDAGVLRQQIHSSIGKTMQGKPRSESDAKALEAFLKTLKPAPSLDRMRGNADEAAIAKGQKIFKNQGCINCHAPPTYTSPNTYDVGLADELGRRKFNPPSLRGVSQRLELVHDGRAKSLKELFLTHQHGDGHLLSEEDREDLLRFLRSL